MKNVTLSIGGRSYGIACAPGDEGRIMALGRMIDDRLEKNPGLGNQSEARTLLFLSLLLADELHDLQQQTAQAISARAVTDEMADILENLAERLETLATKLEGED